MLDHNKDGSISIHEFVIGMLRLKGAELELSAKLGLKAFSLVEIESK